jgi:hypothetical protein
MRARIRIEPDPSQPTPVDVRFLTVLQASDGIDPGVPTLLGTSVASPFQGVRIGRFAAFFALGVVPASPLGLSFVLPRDVSTVVITGLSPGARYGIARSGDKVTIEAGSAAVADEAGVLAF